MTFEEFWRRYYQHLVGDLVAYGRLPQDAEELAGDALRKAWPYIDKVEPPARWAYVRTAGRREAINHNRNANAKRRNATLTTSLDELRDAAHSSTPESRAIAREEIAKLHAGVRAVCADLSGEILQSIVLRRRGHSDEQIAELLGVKPSAIHSRLQRATKQFIQRLGRPPRGIPWIELAGDLIDDHEE